MEQTQASRSAQLKAERMTTELQIKLDRRQQQQQVGTVSGLCSAAFPAAVTTAVILPMC